MPEIPSKQYYRLSEVCQYTDTQPYVLRFWESEFPQLKPTQSRGGQAVYSRRDIELVLRIKRLLNDEAYSISDARKLLEKEKGAPDKGKAKAARSARPARKPRRRSGASQTEPQPTAPALADAPATLESVPKERYEDALEEIAHLRLELNDVETKQRKAESTSKKASEAALQNEQRIKRAIAIIEALIQRLS